MVAGVTSDSFALSMLYFEISFILKIGLSCTMLLKLELLKKWRTEQPQREAPVGSFGKLVNSSRSPSAS